MITMTHMLVGAAAASRKSMSRWALAGIFFGGLLPDLSVMIMVLVARLTNFTGDMWDAPGGLYWQEPWQTFSAISNSFPLYAGGLLLAHLLWRSSDRHKALGAALMGFFAAALLHVSLDFPVHTDDAHVHFWPISDWRFHSFISYYQRSAWGEYVSLFEAGLALVCAVIVWRRFPSIWMRGVIVVLLLPYSMRFIPRDWMFSIISMLFGVGHP